MYGTDLLHDRHHLRAELDPYNAGVLIVKLEAGDDRGVGSDEIARRLSKEEEGCTIM